MCYSAFCEYEDIFGGCNKGREDICPQSVGGYENLEPKPYKVFEDTDALKDIKRIEQLIEKWQGFASYRGMEQLKTKDIEIRLNKIKCEMEVINQRYSKEVTTMKKN